MVEGGQRSTHIFILALVSLLQMGVSALLLNHLSMENWSVIYAEDSEGYLLVARNFLGEQIPPSSLPLLKYRLFSPVVPLTASLIARILSLKYSFLFLNGCLWLASVYLFYRFAQSLLNEKLGFYSALVLATSLPFIIWGLPIMTDMAAFFFAVLNCILITYFFSERKSPFMVLVGTLSLSILTKPTLVSLLLFFILYTFFQRRYMRILPVVCITLIVVGVIYRSLDLSIGDFRAFGYLRHQGFLYVLNALVVCFHWGLPLAVWGFWLEKHKRGFYLTYLVCTFSCYLIFVHNPRLIFVIYPAALPLVVRGLEGCAYQVALRWHHKVERVTILLVSGYVITSNILAGLYLLVTRVLQYRSIESLPQLF